MLKHQNIKPSSPSTSGERVDFRFSNFQALQVPKGWDRLSLSIVSAGTGKVTAKLGKALVRSGGCQWPETLLESVWIPQDDSSIGVEEYLYKCVVSMGSARSGILGEATINLASYVSSRAASTVSLPLKKCNYGTILQVKIHCLTPRTKLRDEESIGTNPLVKEQNDIGPENLFPEDVGMLGLKERSYLPSDSIEGFARRDTTFLKNHSKNEGHNNRVRNSRENSENDSTSKELLQDAEDTIEELRIEAKMWERNARKLMVDIDVLRNEFSDQSKKQADLVMELSAAYAEHESLKKEIENLRTKQETAKDSTFQTTQIHKELEKEMKHQQELNESLALQLQRSQESNIELVSVLQDLEETIEQQRIEIENLSSMQLRFAEKDSALEEAKRKLEEYSLKFHENKSSKAELEAQCTNLLTELARKSNEVDDLQNNLNNLVEIECENEKLKNQLMKLKEARRESENLEEENHKLHASIESLTEELKSLEKSNSELKVKNGEMQKYCMRVDDQLEKSKKSLFDSYKKVETLEENMNLLAKDFSFKEEEFSSALDELVRENKIQMEKIAQVEHLNNENEKMSKVLMSYRAKEEKLKTSLNELELKLTMSHCENQQLLEETVGLKIQLQRTTQLENEFSELRKQFDRCKKEKEQLEATMQAIFGDDEKIKSKNFSFLDKISILQETALEFKNCKLEKVSLEEKLSQAENELTEMEEQNQALVNELTKIERENKLFEQKIHQLKDEKNKSSKRIRALEADINKKISENDAEVEYVEKIKMLENKLAETLETNKKYKIQLQRFRSEERKIQGAASKRTITETESASSEREKFEQIKSSLEAELKDIRQRYLDMSLKYAEVEAQRENLVMKLKTAKNGKKWFS